MNARSRPFLAEGGASLPHRPTMPPKYEYRVKVEVDDEKE